MSLLRVQVCSNRKMVTLQGAVVPVPEGEPVMLRGMADDRGPVAWVRLDDGRELLIAREHLEAVSA